MNSNDPNNPNRLLGIGMSMALAASGKARQEVAITTGVSATHITKMVTGQSNPSQKVLTEFARAVECSISEIYRLGEAALEREEEIRRKEELRQVNRDQDMEAVLRLATKLDDKQLRGLIEELQQIWEGQFGEWAA